MVLHTATIKGKGYAFAEADPTLYHGVSPFNPKVGIINPLRQPIRRSSAAG